MVGAFFQCHKQPVATFHALQSFRSAYPTSTIVLLSDNGYNYKAMADHFNATYIHSNETLGVSVGVGKPEPDILRYRVFLERMIHAVSFIKEDYFMLLEDDVLVNRPYTEPFLGTVNGNCINKISSNLFRKIAYYKGDCSERYYSGHGGSVFNKKQFVEILEKPEIQWLIEHWGELLDSSWANILDSDIFFSIATWTLGGTVHHLEQHKDGRWDAPVCHQFKFLYNAQADSIRHLFEI